MLKMEGIRHRYGRREVLHGVSLAAGPGIYGLLGNNGAGKSTLIKIAATVLPVTRGRVAFGGLERPRGDQAIRQQLGYLPQEYGLPMHLTCLEYLAYVAAMKGLDTNDPVASPEQTLERFGLEDAGRKRVAALSGGMRQRLGLAQAFLGRPRLMILDEPTAGLDPQERVRLRGIIHESAGEATVLLSTHIVSDIERAASRVGIMAGGRLVAEGAPDELIGAANGRVYEVRFDAPEWERVAHDWMRRGRDAGHWPGVVSGVSAVDGEGAAVNVRVVSLAAPEGEAVPVKPTLEDVYLLATSWPDTWERPA